MCGSAALGIEMRWSPQVSVEMGTCGVVVVCGEGCGLMGGVFVFV